ncbi:phage Gp19/Gp15/Gp42 family protein [Faecalicatena contorta]|uniref:phage Gp19/Gp15/Gp42 family protein n=1 Tax=Faecalicatena contorta TaxID=39482 RepID=UPI0019617F49|nr:phage Gp19/Gp15/Gp42 family protein [Faecalicatena contorta]MBM6686798.1 phage Gp19/Gp15/Gp42 family protein [Faecalicatena contorta]MBM6709695.1 phage Gp19/Gp15/Gp42 family protein [Faecalicatena contorta]
MDSFATVEDIELLWRELNPDEAQKAENLLPVVSDSLRYEAQKVGKNLDDMLKEDDALKNVAKSVTVDVVARALMTSTNSEPMEQMSQSALGYSVSGTFLVPGGGLFIKKSELARLGLRRQKCGVVNLYGND